MVKNRLGAEGWDSFALCPILLRPDLPMIKLCELSKKLMSHEISAATYRLHLLAAITALSDGELRTLARLIFPDDHNP